MLNQCVSNPSRLENWIRSVLDPALYDITLEPMLNTIPTVSSLSDLAPTTPVLVRADLDVPIKHEVVEDTSRLHSFHHTIEFCRSHELKPILFGHIGRKPSNTAAPVATALADIYRTRVEFVDDWYDPNTGTITQSFQAAITKANPGELILLENTRKYSFEQALWNIDLEAIHTLVEDLDHLTFQLCRTISQNYIFDALASSNPDWSSVVVPAYMTRAVISNDILTEFKKYVVHARKAQIVIFSGLKMDKLDDLESMLNQGNVKLIIVGGALAMALRKGQAALSGQDISIGLAGSSVSSGKEYFIGPERIQQAQRILILAGERGVQVVLPVDFVLDDQTITEVIPPDRLQMDVGPKTIAHFEAALREFLQTHKEEVTVFYNGVLGKFEDTHFENGTRQMMQMLKMLTDVGAKTYVGGGEGLLALEKYGQISWVTHAFTSGGTILKAMSGRVISYLSSLSYHAREREGG